MRFGYTDEFCYVRLEDITEFITKGATPTTYGFQWVENGIPFFRNDSIKENKFVFGKYSFISSEANEKLKRSEIKENDIIIAITGDIGKVAIIPKSIKIGNINQHIAKIRVKGNYIPYFIYQCLASSSVQKNFHSISTGISMSQLSLQQIRDIKIPSLSISEQSKIAKFLYLINERVDTQIKIIDSLSSQKKAISNYIFKALHKNVNSSVKDFVNYEQPQKYIVQSTEYNDKSDGLYPVLTANQSFILGYTSEKNGIYNKGDCIIFDDFTMDSKYVNFPFKIKSSAIKILTAKEGLMIKYFYEYLLYLDCNALDHKRHYISEIEPLLINVPSLKEQQSIIQILDSFNNKINLEKKLLLNYEKQKKYLLNNLFI